MVDGTPGTRLATSFPFDGMLGDGNAWTGADAAEIIGLLSQPGGIELEDQVGYQLLNRSIWETWSEEPAQDPRSTQRRMRLC